MKSVRIIGKTERRIYDKAANYVGDDSEEGLADPTRLTFTLRDLFDCGSPEDVEVKHRAGGKVTYTPWRDQPWITPVVGSGPLGLPRTFVEVSNNVDEHVLKSLKNGRSTGWVACNEAPGADPELWLSAYVAGLVSTRVGSQSLTSSNRPVSLAPQDEADLALASLLLLVSAQLTRTFHRISLDTARALGRWGSERAALNLDAVDGVPRVHDRLNDLIREFVAPLQAAIGSAEAGLLASQQRARAARCAWCPDGERCPRHDTRAKMDGALLRILDEVRSETTGDAPVVTIIRLQQVTEAAWLYLVRAISGDVYPGWTDLLLRLVFLEAHDSQSKVRGHTRPRWQEMAGLAKAVAGMMGDASHVGHAPDSQDRQHNNAFYDAIAETLWAQHDVLTSLPAESGRRAASTDLPGGSVPQPLAFVTSFDCEVEAALRRRAGDRHKSFSVIIPAFAKSGSEGDFVWLEAVVSTADDHLLTEPVEWRLMGAHRSIDSRHRHPVVVHLMGCPLIPLPRLNAGRGPGSASAHPEAKNLIGQLRANGVGGKRDLVHAITLDEYIALRQGDIEWQWSQDTTTDGGLPGAWFGSDLDGPRRFWMLMGVPFQDPAVRARTLSVLTRPENERKLGVHNEANQLEVGATATDVGGGADAVIDLVETSDERSPFWEDADDADERSPFWQEPDTLDAQNRSVMGIGVADPLLKVTEPSAATQVSTRAAARGTEDVASPEMEPRGSARHRVRGVVISTRVDDEEAKLLLDIGLDIVLDRAEVFSESLTCHAESLRHAIEDIRDRARNAGSGRSSTTEVSR